MKRIYLDYAAATPVDEAVALAMRPFWSSAFANPSAIHKEGVIAKKSVEDARRRVATLIRAQADEIVFTASATESANLALYGAVRAWKRENPTRTPHLILSAVEHDAVFSPTRELEQEGARLSILPVDEHGIVSLTALKELICEDTVLIAVMYANNEIGTAEPLADVAKVIRKWKKEFNGAVRGERTVGSARYPLLYSDASQAPNYLDCSTPTLGVDLMTLSGGKIYGAKGVGMLFVSRGVSLHPLIFGGGQEGGRRAGTENVPAIIGFAAALEKTLAMREEESARLAAIQKETVLLLEKTFPNIVINGSMEHRLPNNINFSFPNVDHEYLALALDARSIAVATKSACAESEAEVSHVLKALAGEDEQRPTSGIRVSMGRQTTREDMNEFVAVLANIMSTMMGTL